MNEYIKHYLDQEGRLTAFPSKRKLKIACMFYLVKQFEAGKTYTEKELNECINESCTFRDAALIRREMYNYHFIDRSQDGRTYWVEEPQPEPASYGLSE